MATETIFSFLGAVPCCGSYKPQLLIRKEEYTVPLPRRVNLTIELRCLACGEKQALTKTCDGGKDYFKRVRPLLDTATKDAQEGGL